MITVSFDIGIINLAVAVVQDKDPIILQLISLFPKCPKNLSIDKLSESIYTNLDILIQEIKDKTTQTIIIDNVLLENQPSRINGKMKTVQMIIYSYFYNLKHYEHSVSNIHLVNPSLKLQEYNLPKLANKRDSYKQNKETSINLCLEIYKENPYITNIIKESSKKDDLCDALLQSIAWQKKNNIQ